MTSEHAYQSEKFDDPEILDMLKNARSAYDAMKLAHNKKEKRKKNWGDVKLRIMKQILHEKVKEHSYVKAKLLDTGDKKLIENSWRDSFWGWGPNRDGANHLGRLWEEVRYEVRADENK